ncbi:hypothetical protein KL86DES1_10445 [uncultured Desulfovibrio sp.]|uniref:Uncharacterized protein n=1 Tax=uncultured Desulfovibrio sp. TaxID=167968 RepID=A0A212KZD8_9BACT|nr:hypothetical protein KL86DES1_10445 [uncultured Desulfovibrio sp.]
MVVWMKRVARDFYQVVIMYYSAHAATSVAAEAGCMYDFIPCLPGGISILGIAFHWTIFFGKCCACNGCQR